MADSSARREARLATEGYGHSARFRLSHTSSGHVQQTQFSSVPHIDRGGNTHAPKAGQMTWHAHPEKTHDSTMVNHKNRRDALNGSTTSGKDFHNHTIHTTGPEGTLREPGVHDWTMSGRADCFEPLYGEESERTRNFASQTTFSPDTRFSARAKAMQTASQETGSWSDCVATQEQRAARTYKVRTINAEQKREVQRPREGMPVKMTETGPVVLDTARSELRTDRTTGHCDKDGDPYRRGHVQRSVAGMPSDSGPLNKIRRHQTGDLGWILDGADASERQ